ncbi:MAG: alpha/beta hydrolase, partial [Pseudomonadota bacterium]
MDILDGAQPRRWTVDSASPAGGQVTIAGWYFGGEGPVALLHHANGMCGALWAPVARELAKTYTVFAVDARGHGDSDKLTVPDDYAWQYFVDDLRQVAEQVLRETGETVVALGLGSSFGGIITAAAAAAPTNLFKQVVMLDPPIHPDPATLEFLGRENNITRTDERAGLVAQTLKRRAVWPSRSAARQAWADKPLFASWCDAAFDLYINEGMRDIAEGEVALKCSPQVEAHIFQTTGSLLPQDYAPHVEVPVHLVHARLGFFDADWLNTVANMFPQG